MTLYTERLYSSAFEDGFDYAVQKMYVNARQAKKNAKKARAEEEAAQQALEKEQFKADVAEINKKKAEERAIRRAAEAANPPAPKPLSAAAQGKKLSAAASGASRSYQKAAVAAYDANQAARNAIGTSKYGALANEASKLRAVADEKEQAMNVAKAAKKEQKTQVRDAIKEQKQAESQRRMAIMAERAKRREEKRVAKLKAKNEARSAERQAYLNSVGGEWQPKPIADQFPGIPKNPVRAARKEHGRLNVTPEEIAAADARINGTAPTTQVKVDPAPATPNISSKTVGSKSGSTTSSAKKGGSAAAKNDVLGWIKKNPYKSAGIAAGLAAAGYGGYKFATRNKEDNSEE